MRPWGQEYRRGCCLRAGCGRDSFSNSRLPSLIPHAVEHTMRSIVLRLAAAAGTIVAAACVEHTPVNPTSNTITAATTTAAPATQAVVATADPGDRYLIVFKPGLSGAPAINDELRTNGGRLEGLHENLGFAVVSGI